MPEAEHQAGQPTRPYIGGQAVLEGVMMRAPTSFAVVVRRRDGSLHVREREMVDGRQGISKLPLVRFCQPADRSELRYWFELLGPIHVSFVVCAENGRALAALDIEKPHRKVSERTQKIKQAVLDACRIRYVKCRADQLPTASELALLVPSQGEAHRPWVPSSLPDHPSDMRSTLAHAVRARRGEAESQWVESGYSADSFFAPDGSAEHADSGPLPLTPERPMPAAAAPRPDPLEPSGRWAGATPRPTPSGFGNDDNEGTHIIGRR